MMVRMVSIYGVPTNAIYHPSMLSLKWRNPGEWSIVSNLMCDKMNKPVWAIIQGVYQKVGNVVDHGDVDVVMVKKVLHLDPRVKEDELKEIFGIQVENNIKQNHQIHVFILFQLILPQP